jgi:hypothetical protein
MANKKISQLAETITATGGYFVIDDGSTEAKKISATNLTKLGLSTAGVSSSGIDSQAVTTSYAQVQLTDTIVYQSDTGVISIGYDGSGFDEITIAKTGIYKFSFIFYIDGTPNMTLFLKTYKNGVAINPGDPVGANLQGTGKPVAFPFSGLGSFAEGDVLTFYAKGDSAGTFTIKGGNYIIERTPY